LRDKLSGETIEKSLVAKARRAGYIQSITKLNNVAGYHAAQPVTLLKKSIGQAIAFASEPFGQEIVSK